MVHRIGIIIVNSLLKLRDSKNIKYSVFDANAFLFSVPISKGMICLFAKNRESTYNNNVIRVIDNKLMYPEPWHISRML